jgi:hypothetical protein
LKTIFKVGWRVRLRAKLETGSMSATSMCSTPLARPTPVGTQAVNHDVNLKVKRRDTGIALLSGLCRSLETKPTRRKRQDLSSSGKLRLGVERSSRCTRRREHRGGQRTTPAGELIEFDGQKAICACGKLCTEPRFWNSTTEMLRYTRRSARTSSSFKFYSRSESSRVKSRDALRLTRFIC